MPPTASLDALTSTDHLLVCTACGTQFDETDLTVLTSCRICDDPRQYVPPTGQSFTTLSAMRQEPYHNTHEPLLTTPQPSQGHGHGHGDDPASRVTQLHSISTSPKFGIGQRAILVCTPAGNLLWDCLTFLDRATVEWISAKGGLAAIAISHPHYYSTHLLWSAVFQCPVYLSADDAPWLCRTDVGDSVRRFVPVGQREADILPLLPHPIRLLKLGGHFPGSLACLADGALLVADTLVTTPAGLGDWKDKPRPSGMNSFAFMWSIPNMIPLAPAEIATMWSVLKKHDFDSTHGAFVGQEIIAKDVKKRVLESMQIQVRGEGYERHMLLEESWDV